MQADNCNKFKLCSNEKTNMDNKGAAEGYLEKLFVNEMSRVVFYVKCIMFIKKIL